MSTPIFAEGGWRDGWYVLPHEVTWRDLDAMGHVNNAVYFSFFEWARTKYWFDLHGLGDSAKDPQQLTFIVARAECDFKLQLELAERIEICVRIGELRSTSFDFDYRVNGRTGLASTGRVVVVLYSWSSRSKLAIDDELRRKIQSFQQAAR